MIGSTMNSDTTTEEAQSQDIEESQSVIDWLSAAPESINLEPEIHRDKIGDIGQRVLREYDIDKKSRADWEKSNKTAMDLALQVAEEKTFPWPNASNVKYPLITTAAIQFAARAYPAIVDGQNVVKGKVNGDDSGLFEVQIGPDGQPVVNPETGEPVSKEITPEGIKQEKADRIAKHMSWQLTEEMDEWEADMDRMLVAIPILGVTFKKSYYDPSKSRNCSEMILPDCLVINYKAKSLETAPRITQIITLYPYEYEERVRAGIFTRIENVTADGEDEDAPIEFLEQHRRLDLDGDGYSEPYIVTIHKETAQVVRIVANYDEDSVYLTDDGVQRIEPTEYFTKYGFIPNPDSGIYDLGFGVLLNPLSETTNTLINQMLDAGTLQNTGGGFIGDGLRMKGGAIRFTPGEFKKVQTSGQKIADNIYHMQHQGPSAVLFQLLGMMIEAGKDITSTKDILTGEQQGINTPATTTLALIEQGLKTYTAIFKRIHRALGKELRKLYSLNAKYLDPEQYFTFQDSREAVAQQDYNDEEMDVTPISDPSVVTDMQQLGRANFLMGFMNDPFVDQMELRRRIMGAATITDLDSLLVEPQQPPPDPKAIKAEVDAKIAMSKEEREKVNDLINNLKTIADTEAVEVGNQMGLYLSQLEGLMNASNAGGMGGMAGPPNNGVLPQVPEGLPQAGGATGAPVSTPAESGLANPDGDADLYGLEPSADTARFV